MTFSKITKLEIDYKITQKEKRKKKNKTCKEASNENSLLNNV